jgi:hypothetical protein
MSAHWVIQRGADVLAYAASPCTRLYALTANGGTTSKGRPGVSFELKRDKLYGNQFTDLDRIAVSVRDTPHGICLIGDTTHVEDPYCAVMSGLSANAMQETLRWARQQGGRVERPDQEFDRQDVCAVHAPWQEALAKQPAHDERRSMDAMFTNDGWTYHCQVLRTQTEAPPSCHGVEPLIAARHYEALDAADEGVFSAETLLEWARRTAKEPSWAARAHDLFDGWVAAAGRTAQEPMEEAATEAFVQATHAGAVEPSTWPTTVTDQAEPHGAQDASSSWT